MELTHWLPGLEDSIAAADCMLEQDGVVEVDLPTAVQLVSESPVEPLGRCGPYQSGAACISSVLQSVRRLPDPGHGSGRPEQGVVQRGHERQGLPRRPSATTAAFAPKTRGGRPRR